MTDDTTSELSQMRVGENGRRVWRLPNGASHRVGGPAVEHADGSREWLEHGLPHRLDGPAVELADGRTEWWVRGRRHRIDGPALIRGGGGVDTWYVNGAAFDAADHRTLEALWNAGEVEVITHVLSVYRRGGPRVAELAAAVQAACA